MNNTQTPTIYEWMVDGMYAGPIKEMIQSYGLESTGKLKDLKDRLKTFIRQTHQGVELNSNGNTLDNENQEKNNDNHSKVDNSIINNITEYKRDQLELLNGNTLKKICKVKRIPIEEIVSNSYYSGVKIREFTDNQLLNSIITTQGFINSLHEYHRGLVNYTLPITIIFKILRYSFKGGEKKIEFNNNNNFSLINNNNYNEFGKINLKYLMISKQLFHFATLQLFNTFGIQYYSNKAVMAKVLVTRFHNPVCALKNITTLGVRGDVLNDVSSYLQNSNSSYKDFNIFKNVRHLLMFGGHVYNSKVANLFSPGTLCKFTCMGDGDTLINQFQWKTLKLWRYHKIKEQNQLKHFTLYGESNNEIPMSVEKCSLKRFRFEYISKELYSRFKKFKFCNSIGFNGDVAKQLIQLLDLSKLIHLTIGNVELNEVDITQFVHLKELVVVKSNITYSTFPQTPSVQILLYPYQKFKDIMILPSILKIKMKPISSFFVSTNIENLGDHKYLLTQIPCDSTKWTLTIDGGSCKNSLVMRKYYH